MAVIEVPSASIVDWDSSHDVLAEALRFPDYYGRNGNAFIDCLGNIASGRDVPPLLRPRETLTIHLGEVSSLRRRVRSSLRR